MYSTLQPLLITTSLALAGIGTAAATKQFGLLAGFAFVRQVYPYLDRGFGPGPTTRKGLDPKRGPVGDAGAVFQTNFAFGRAVRLLAQNVHPGYWQSAHPDEDGYRPDQIKVSWNLALQPASR